MRRQPPHVQRQELLSAATIPMRGNEVLDHAGNCHRFAEEGYDPHEG